jgi:hypothetical protein
MMAFDTNLAPIVGQQITRTGSNGATVDPRIDLLEQRADAGECDLVAKGMVAGALHGSLYAGLGQYLPDRSGALAVSSATLRARAATAGQEVTFTCVPPGSGVRIGIDQDGDGAADGDERDGGTDPANPASIPLNAPPLCNTSTAVVFKRATLTDKRGVLSLSSEIPFEVYNQETVTIIVADTDGVITNTGVAGTEVETKGSAYRYRAPRGAIGIKNIMLREKPNGIFKVTLKTIGAWAIGAANQPPASTQITLNIGGQCLRGNATKVH